MKKAYFKKSFNWFTVLLILFCLSNATAVSAQKIPTVSADSLRFKKLAPALLASPSKNITANFRIQVKDQAQFIAWLQKNIPRAQISKAAATLNILNISDLSAADLSLLVQNPEVIFIDNANRIPQEERALNNSNLSSNHIESVHHLYPDLNGSGLVLSVKESPFDSTDIDFRGRVLKNAAFALGATTHAANMATLAAGAGNTAPSGKGVAWGATVTASDFSQLLPDKTDELKAARVTVQNHSYGVAIENYYGLETQVYDQQINQYPELLHVFSSGNSGNLADKTGTYAGLTGWANLTGQFKMSKNTLSVGATNSDGKVAFLSSRGPAYDGRVKPELVALGENGTSEASALVSGISVLIQQAYKQQQNIVPASALVKAVLLNSADDAGRPEVDFETGYGNANALAAIRTVKENRYFTGTAVANEVKKYTVSVPAGAVKLKVTLVWHDVAATPNAAKAQVNDLDLVLFNKSTNQTWKPWVLSSYPHPDSLKLIPKRRADHLNNIEQVTLDLPVDGDYEIQISGYQIPQGQQSFSIAYETQLKAFEWRYPAINSNLISDSTMRLRWFTSPGITSSGTLEYRFINTNTWQTISNNISVNANYFDWKTPDVAGLAQVRLKYADQIIESEPFLISRQLQLQIGYNCAETVMFHWAKQPEATGYQVYRLGKNFLEPYQQVTDTLFSISKASMPSTHFAVGPIIGNKIGLKSVTVNYLVEIVGCYVKSFLPRQLVTDSVLFDVELSTLYGVVLVSLQKLVNGEYQTIQTMLAGNTLTKVFQDLNPKAGRNDYRLLITTNTNAVFYSNTEYVIYAPENFVQVYPNPIQRGNKLSVVTEQDVKTLISVYDSLGKIVVEYSEAGVVKEIPTTGLKPGLYIIRTKFPGGNLTATRLLVY